MGGDTITFDYNIANLGNAAEPTCVFSYSIRTCEGVFVAGLTIEPPGTSLVGSISYTIATDGIYILSITMAASHEADDPSTTMMGVNGTCVISSDGPMVVNPITALWDDSGTTRQLEACPKMLLPPLTENTGDWYINATEAGMVISDLTVDCIGYSPTLIDSGGEYTFTFNPVGGSSLILDGDVSIVLTTLHTFQMEMWGSINLMIGETLSLDYAITGTVNNSGVSVTIYDEMGTPITTFSILPSPGAVSGTTILIASVTNSGRYIVKAQAVADKNPGNPNYSANFELTSSGTLTVNPVQALYDVELDCPARLDCS